MTSLIDSVSEFVLSYVNYLSDDRFYSWKSSALMMHVMAIRRITAVRFVDCISNNVRFCLPVDAAVRAYHISRAR